MNALFLLGDRLCWSASDLTRAAECEYALLRTLDYKLEWADPIDTPQDVVQEHIARLGDRHEAQLLDEWRASGDVVELPHISAPFSTSTLETAADAILQAIAAEPKVVYQAAFFDGEFFGYADFVERAADGWVVCDAKLARQAKPRALLQLGAYADQMDKLDLPLSSRVSLLLGNGQRADFQAADVIPAFRERRARLRSLLAEHRQEGAPVQWGDDRYVACGRCDECKHAAEQASDVTLVAGLRMQQRLKLRAAGITTIADLAAATSKPDDMAQTTFDKLHRQAAIQWKQLKGGEDAPVEYELTATAAKTLALLPAPSEGDLFFDFEGDPLYDEGDLSRTGLEYLWGVMDAAGNYRPLWAHSSDEERAAFVEFMDLVAECRAKHPDMHIYHYAPYETTALKRLAMVYQTKEKELDDLLRSEVFVDLYATVRGSVRVSAPSYSIKKLEPLHMGTELRSEDGVKAGDASILAYHEYRELRESEPEKAEAFLTDLQDYNTYDCLSTLRLRDWLLERADEAGVGDQIEPRVLDVQGEELSETDPVFVDLMARSGPKQRLERSAEEQAYAMLATGIDYYRRERKQFWWEHYDRLLHPLEEWCDTRDVFTVESVEVLQDWAKPSAKAHPRRVLRLTGDWAPGSKPRGSCFVIYGTPNPPRVGGPERAVYGAGPVDKIEYLDGDERVLLLTEARPEHEIFSDFPVALTPPAPPGTKDIEAAIHEVAAAAAKASELPRRSALDILARQTPRLHGIATLPSAGTTVENVVSALCASDNSYVAIQGPPGTGKTYTGSRVIKELVERHHWRIGVVAQSHAVVENMLSGIVKAGLDPALIGKNDNDSDDPSWTVLNKGVPPRAVFLDDHRETGCVLGGTAWTFSNANLIERGGLDLLVIDEAGQFALAPTIGVSVSAKRLLLLGDPQQLPQVSQGSHAEPVDESALGWLMEGHDTLPPEYGYFLAESYRMHPDLCAKVSTLSYDGRLESAEPAGHRELVGVEPGLHVVRIDHTGNRTTSLEEADAVVDQVQAHLGSTWVDPEDDDAPRELTAKDIIVVAPYNAQVATIRHALDKAGYPDVRVGTVDKFQGQEAPIAIVSMTASSHGDVPRGMGFLLNRNRINVAISRAQWKAILIRSEGLTSFMPTSTQGLLELGGFIGLCASAKEERCW